MGPLEPAGCLEVPLAVLEKLPQAILNGGATEERLELRLRHRLQYRPRVVGGGPEVRVE